VNGAMATKLRESERIPMSWEEYQQLPDTVRGGCIDGELVVSPTSASRLDP